MERNDLEGLAQRAREGDKEARAALAEAFPPRAGMALRADSYDENAGTVEGIITTDAPVRMFDWMEFRYITEHLAPSGFQVPERGQIPVLDTHSRTSVEDIVGSANGITAQGGDVVGTIRFATSQRAQAARQLVADGHLTDLSAGYQVIERTMVEEGESLTLAGRSYPGPCHVVTRWRLKEVSVCPIGADEGAKLRSMTTGIPEGLALANHKEAPAMTQPTESPEVKPEGGERTSNATNQAAEIAALCLLAGDVVTDGERAEFILAGAEGKLTVDKLRTDLLARRAVAKAKPEAKPDTDTLRATCGEDNNVRSFSDAFADSLAIRSGKVGRDGAVTVERDGARKETKLTMHERANDLSRLPVLELLRMHLEMHGVRAVGKTTDQLMSSARELRQRAGSFTTGDFTTLLENAMNKLVLIGYQSAPSTWRQITRVISANDMRQHNLYKHGGFESLARVGENGEIPMGDKPDGKKEVITPKNFARVFRITDETIINDDLQALTQIPIEMGEAAEYTINELVWFVLLSNPTMLEDGVALFDAAHNNLSTGVAPPSKTTLDLIYGKAGLMRGLNGKAIRGTDPAWIAFPPQIRSTVNQLLNSEFVPGANNNETNIYRGLLAPIMEPLLAHGVTIETESGVLTAAGSAAAYFLGSSPGVLPGVVAAFYGGETPRIRRDDPIGVLGSDYEVLLRVEAAASEWRGLQKHAGA